MLRNIILIIVLLVVVASIATADVVYLNPSDDAYVDQQFPDSTAGGYSQVVVGSASSFYFNTLIEFDLSSYFGITVNSANIRLYVYDSTGNFPTDEIYIARNNADWDEGTVTWNNKPGFTEYTLITAPSTYDWWEIEVTDWVQNIVDGTHLNYGFQIYKNNMGNVIFYMYSKEYSTHHPELVIDYYPVAIQSISLGSIKSLFE